MLRSVHAQPPPAHSLLPLVNDGAVAKETALADEELEVLRANEAYLWLLVLAATAECVTTCFLPDVAISGWPLNLSATALNFVGPFMDGVSHGYERLPKSGAPSLACLQFRSSFLGVFTSFAFMADHAGDLSAQGVAVGSLYVCTSVVGGCCCFLLGKAIVQPVMTSPAVVKLVMTVSATKKPSLLAALTVFIGLTAVRAVFGPHGFVRDPTDPQFIGPLQVADGEELFLGIFMSCSAILLSDYICDSLKPGERTQDAYLVDWGCWACNFVACVFVWLAYGASRLSANALTSNLLILKFVSSFCGSISCFSAAVSHISRLWDARQYRAAAWNFCLHVLIGLAFIPLLSKQELPTQ